MALKILRMFLIFFTIAALLNVANFIVCYYIHVNNSLSEKESAESVEEPTTTKWDDKFNSLLICGANLSDCAHGFTSEMDNSKANDSNETTEKFNGIYYYLHEAVLRNTRFCPKNPPGLGPVETDTTLIELNAFDEMFSYIKPGGFFMPMQCIPRQSIAIVVPMFDVNRNWKKYFGTFLFYIHLFLMKQLAEYQIFLIGQEGDLNEPYARGKLLNIGFIEAQKMRRNGWDCFIFHDAYYIPTDARNLYRCTYRPRRLIYTNDTEKFGGVVAMKPLDFMKVNGFSNLIWNNDGDYINMYQRLNKSNYFTETISSSVGKYITLKFYEHINLPRSSQLLDKSHATTPTHLIEGLSSVSYRLHKVELRQLYTYVTVNFNH